MKIPVQEKPRGAIIIAVLVFVIIVGVWILQMTISFGNRTVDLQESVEEEKATFENIEEIRRQLEEEMPFRSPKEQWNQAAEQLRTKEGEALEKVGEEVLKEIDQQNIDQQNEDYAKEKEIE